MDKPDITLSEFRELLLDSRITPVVDMLVNTELCISKGDAKRMIRQKAIKLNNWQVENELTYICWMKNKVIGFIEFVKDSDVVLDIKTEPLRVKICLSI